jgi:galactonate dehydratase
MRITAVETIHFPRGVAVHFGAVQYLWVRIHTDEGLVGLGETYPHPEAEQAVVHRSLAPVLLGRDPGNIERLWSDMLLAVSYSGWAGAEMRAISAVDLALWDLAGKRLGVPVWGLLGGASRTRIPVYNTCYDHVDFVAEPERLACGLLEAGVRAMKIWPFDEIARETGGQFITAAQIREGADPIRRIREAVGDDMDIAVEFHGFWNLPCAIRIARALEPYHPLWLEEMLPQDNAAAYLELARATPTPLCLSERLMTRWGFRELLENRAARIIMPDLCWCGGLTEARKIAAAAEMHYLPIAPHNCGGPLLHLASAHFATNVTNLFLLETVRRHYLHEYAGLLTSDLPVQDGVLAPPAGPGLGAELSPSVLQEPALHVRVTTA